MNERFDLTGRSVIITGGGKGIGKVYAQEFAKAGARVVAADIDGAAAKSVAEALAAQGFETLGLATDIASEESTKAMAQAALERFGAIDVLLNNASLMSVLPRRSWLEMPIEEWDRVMAVNLRGMFLSCRAVFPAMEAQRRGKIVNNSSSRVWEGTPNRLHYTTSKPASSALLAPWRAKSASSASPSTPSPPACRRAKRRCSRRRQIISRRESPTA